VALVVILLILAWLSQQKLVRGDEDRFAPVAASRVAGSSRGIASAVPL
jgi:hypothetical protein